MTKTGHNAVNLVALDILFSNCASKIQSGGVMSERCHHQSISSLSKPNQTGKPIKICKCEWISMHTMVLGEWMYLVFHGHTSFALTHLDVITATTVMRIHSLLWLQTFPWLLIHAMKDVIRPKVSQHRWAHQRWRGSHRGKGPWRWEVWDSMSPQEWSIVEYKYTHECKNLPWNEQTVPLWQRSMVSHSLKFWTVFHPRLWRWKVIIRNTT